MTLADSVDLPDAYGRGLTRLLQAFMAAVAVYGLVRFRLGLVLTGGIPLLITLVPAVLRRDYGVPLDWGWTLWIATAVAIHALGSLWAYRAFGWFDDLAHVVSGSLVAAVGYALTMALDRHADGVEVPEAYRGAYLLLVVLAVGVAWENFEHAIEVFARVLGFAAPLVQYGATDVAKDLLMDAVGAVLVALWATPAIRDVPEALGRRFVEE